MNDSRAQSNHLDASAATKIIGDHVSPNTISPEMTLAISAVALLKLVPPQAGLMAAHPVGVAIPLASTSSADINHQSPLFQRADALYT